MRVLLLALILNGCATSYQKEGFAGGYKDCKVGENKFMVTFTGNAFTSRGMVEEYAMRRAREVCNQEGYGNFELLNQSNDTSVVRMPDNYDCQADQGFGNNWNVQCSNRGGQVIQKPQTRIVFSCYN